MNDGSQLSQEEYELNYILKKLEKRETEKNRAVLCKWEGLFKDKKGGQHTKSYTKDEFYRFLLLGGIGQHLE